MWSAILGVPVTPQQAILCMIAVKISRESRKAKRDNRTDIAGYAECLDMIEERLAQEQADGSCLEMADQTS